MAARRPVVVSGDAAGMSAAAQARRRRTPEQLGIVAFERGRATSYSACGIPYWIGGLVAREPALVARTPEQHRARGVDVRTRTEVTAIDLARRVVRWRGLDSGQEGDEPFDALHYAAGSVPMRPPVPGRSPRSGTRCSPPPARRRRRWRRTCRPAEASGIVRPCRSRRRRRTPRCSTGRRRAASPTRRST